MRWLPPLVLHGAHRVSQAVIEEHAQTFAQHLQSWPQWPEIDFTEPTPDCSVPADARPTDGV
ncbi:MAG: hypothetical protein LH480_12970 [Rubrivivax sp.]|nr:hypothetical protein [Rubrivivax sp.]